MLQQQQPEVLLTPQVVSLNPQLAGPFNPQGPQLFVPNQGNQFTPMLVPNGQQDQLGPPQDPNVPQQALNPGQVRLTSCCNDHPNNKVKIYIYYLIINDNVIVVIVP